MEKMKESVNYEEWIEYAKSLDKLQGHDVWKHEKESPYYDYQRIEHRYL